jgi:antitoxin component of RelBE/YafQ-DinJ toxin-antitoxin module
MIGKKNNLVQVSVTVNSRIWKESKTVLQDLGISRSAFINVTLTQLVRESKGQRSPMERMDDTVGTLFKLTRNNRKRKTA